MFGRVEGSKLKYSFSEGWISKAKHDYGKQINIPMDRSIPYRTTHSIWKKTDDDYNKRYKHI